MNKKVLIPAMAIISTLTVALGALALSRNNHVDASVRASDAKAITWNATTGGTATTSSGNKITLQTRYADEWVFGEDDLFADTTATNSFIDNVTAKDQPFQNLLSFTIVYSSVGDGDLFVEFHLRNPYIYNSRAHVINPVSGQKYTIGVDAFDYINCSSSDTFQYILIHNSSKTSVSIESFSLEYTCE